MSFSAEWDKSYSDNTHLSVWPWSELISYFHRYARPFSSKTKVLEIGFGAGANIPFFKSLGVDYSWIDGSQAIHSRVCERYPELKKKLYVGDFTSFEFPEKYDVIVDRASMSHNSTLAIKKALKHLSECLNIGGKYIGIHWFSTRHSDYLLGDKVDEFTKNNIQRGSFAGVGNVHFSNKEHLTEIFSEAGFEIVKLEHTQISSEIPCTGHLSATWELVAEKK